MLEMLLQKLRREFSSLHRLSFKRKLTIQNDSRPQILSFRSNPSRDPFFRNRDSQSQELRPQPSRTLWLRDVVARRSSFLRVRRANSRNSTLSRSGPSPLSNTNSTSF